MSSPSQRRVSPGRLLAIGLAAGIAAHAAHATLGFGGPAVDRFFDDWLLNGLITATSVACLMRGFRVRAERLAWLVLGAAMLCWSGGFIYWTIFIVRDASPPYPSPADVLWLAYYPAAYVALVLIIRSRIREFQKSLWLDGIIGGLAVAPSVRRSSSARCSRARAATPPRSPSTSLTRSETCSWWPSS